MDNKELLKWSLACVTLLLSNHAASASHVEQHIQNSDLPSFERDFAQECGFDTITMEALKQDPVEHKTQNKIATKNLPATQIKGYVNVAQQMLRKRTYELENRPLNILKHATLATVIGVPSSLATYLGARGFFGMARELMRSERSALFDLRALGALIAWGWFCVGAVGGYGMYKSAKHGMQVIHAKRAPQQQKNAEIINTILHNTTTARMYSGQDTA